MKRWLILSVLILSFFLTTTTYPIVTQVDGSVVPQTNRMQTCLNSSLGEGSQTIDAIFDADVRPEIFIPVQGEQVVTTDVCEGAGYENSFGWYNVGDDVTNPNNLYTILNCNQEPGSTVTVNIANDPRYRGGYIGFWLRTPERLTGGTDPDNCGSATDTQNRIYFTQSILNDDGNYVHFLVYRSVRYTNSFYFGFEDLFRGGDNDFEDMLVRVSGLIPPCDPRPEECNGRDDDCDGRVDEELERECATACGVGHYYCVGGEWDISTCDAPQPQAETCNGLDDDCDGEIDEGIPPGGNCGNEIGECSPGTLYCIRGSWECIGWRGPSQEVCDGLDNDCDGRTDEEDPQIGAPCGTDRGECEYGTIQCVNGSLQCVGGIGPSQEVCDGLDNDCDGETDEEDPQIGVSCGEAQGECRPGVFECISGSLVCVGGRGPSEERCNGLDDDCDGEIDEGNPEGGGSCGNSIGECESGTLVCRNGHLVCEGGIGPQQELCDGLDNDCDGVIDDGDPEGGGECGTNVGVCETGILHCINGRLVCVGGIEASQEVCDGLDNDCDGEIDEEALCEGDAICINGECAVPCEPTEFPCPIGKECIDGYCVSGPCSNVECGEGEICINGECVNLCEQVSCPEGYRCVNGRCVEDNCYGTGCPPGKICINYQCIDDPCIDVECGEHQFCRLGECIQSCGMVECSANEICVDGSCIKDPCADISCSEDETCIDGECIKEDPCKGVSCGRGRTCYKGECIDDLCLYIKCPEGERCEYINGNAQCNIEKPQTRKEEWGTASGGGIFTFSCNISSTQDRNGSLFPYLLIILSILFIISKKRLPKITGFVLLLTLTQKGCTYKPYCWSCSDGGIEDKIPDSESQDQIELVPIPDGCTPSQEICDGLDNNCDGRVDEDFDLNSDPNNCGECGRRCLLPHAFPACVNGECVIERCDVNYYDLDRNPNSGCEYHCINRGIETCDGLDNDCDGRVDEGFDLNSDPNNCGRCGVVCAFNNAESLCINGQCVMGECYEGFVDVDGDMDNGCEYNCTPSGQENCDYFDNDCDGRIDEDFDLESDSNNCGRCGRECNYYHGIGLCNAGQCELIRCEPNWYDIDQNPLTGCEYSCSPTGDEICDGIDNDCDGLTDEEFPELGRECGESRGSCEPGTIICRFGQLICEGGIGPSQERCDGLDNDCDGEVDEGNPGGGARCGTTDIGICEYGTLVCQNSQLVCRGNIEPSQEICDGLDNDCDGEVDEGNPGGGARCGTTDVGICEYGALICQNGQLICGGSYVGPESELCDGEDDDCDGTTDEGCPSNSNNVRLDSGSNPGTSHSSFLAMDSDNNRVVVAYVDRRDGYSTIYATYSNDGGEHWRTPDIKIPTSTSNAVSPAVGIKGNTVCIAWEDFRISSSYRNIYVRCSNDGGVSWGNENRVDINQNTDSFGIDIEVESDAIYVVWENMDTNRARHIYLAVSRDGGSSWQAPIRVDHLTGPQTPIASEAKVSGDPGGYVYVVWRDNRHGPGAIYFNRSTNYGQTFINSDIRIDTGTPSEAHSRNPKIKSNGTGRVYIAWEDELPIGSDSKYKIFLRYSTDYGSNFSQIIRLDKDTLPHDSFNPEIAICETGSVHIVWEDYRDGLPDIYVISSSDGINWPNTDQRVDKDNRGMGGSTHPTISCSQGWIWIAWEDSRNGRRDIYYNFSMDEGGTFQPIDFFAEDTNPGSFDSYSPFISASDHRAVIVWIDHRNGNHINGDIYSVFIR